MLNLARIVVSVLVAVLVTIGSGVTRPGYGASGWQSFTHPKYGFSISLPPGWTPVAPESQLFAMFAIGPKTAGSTEFRTNVNVVVDSAPSGITIDDFDAIADRMLQRVFPGHHVLRTDRTQLGKYPAVLRYATWRSNYAEVYQIQLGVIAGSRVYVVTGTTLANSPRIKEEALLLQQILVTFRPPSPAYPPTGSGS